MRSPEAVQVATLTDLESLAMAHNPTLVQANMRVRAAQAKCLQVGLYPNPVAAYRGDEMGDEGRAGMQGGFVAQELVTGRKLRLNRAVVSQEVQQALWAYDAQRWRVLNDVRLAFYEVLVAQRTVQLDEELVRIGQQGLKATESLLAAKEVSRVDVLQAHIECESAKVKLAGARNQADAARRRLAAVVGVPDVDLSTLQGNLDETVPQLAWEESLQRLMTHSPQLAEARFGVQRAQWSVQREYAQRIPNLITQTSVQRDNATGYTIAGLEIAMPLPIFNRNQGNISRAQAELVAAQHEVARVELRLYQRLATAFRRYATARQEVEKYSSDLLPSAKQSLELVTAGYRQGEFGYLTLLTAQRTYFRVNLTYLESLRELRASNVALEGLLLSGALDGDSEFAFQADDSDSDEAAEFARPAG